MGVSPKPGDLGQSLSLPVSETGSDLPVLKLQQQTVTTMTV